MIDKNECDGSVTVFAAMSFMLVVSVICVLIEGARCQGARVMVAMAADMSLDSMFAGFERELLDKYGVLLFDGADGGDSIDEKYISDSIMESMKGCLETDKGLIFTKGTDFYGIEIDEVKVTGVLTAADAFGLIWRKSVNDYSKIDYSAKLLESLLGIELVENESKVVKEASDILDDCTEQISSFYSQYLSLIEHVDGIKTQSNGVNFDKLKSHSVYVKSLGPGGSTQITQENMSVSDYRIFEMVDKNLVDIFAFRDIFMGDFEAAISGEIGYIDNIKGLAYVIREFFKDLKNETEKAINLIDDMRGDEELISEKMAAAVQYISSISSIESTISEQSLEGLKDSLASVEEERDKVLKRLGDAEAMYEVLKSNLELVKQVCERCPDMSFIRNDGVNIDKAEEAYYRYQEAFEYLEGYRTDSLWLDYTDVVCRDEDKSLLGCIYDYSMNGLLSLVLPADTDLSDKTIGNEMLADLYGVRGDRAEYIDDEAANFMNELLFNLYITDCFENFTDNDGVGLLDYEQEYIVFGKSSDKDNFKAAVSSISAIRLGCNMTYILTDTQKKSEAYKLAMAALGFTGMAVLVKGLQYVILTAWALGETVVDMRMLLAGKKVPLLKKKGEWKLELNDLIAGKLDIDEEKKDDKNDEGMDYGQYLAAVMLLKDSQDKAYRSMAVAEMYMISKGAYNFRLKNYIYGLEISVLYHIGEGQTKYTYKCSYTY